MTKQTRRMALLAALSERRAEARRKARIAKGGERNKAQEKLVAGTLDGWRIPTRGGIAV